MTTLETVQLVASIGGTAVALATAYWVYRGSDKASERTTQVQEQSNEIALFKELTQGQRNELNDAKAQIRDVRKEAAEQLESASAEIQSMWRTASAAETAAQTAQLAAERCQHQVDVLTEAYRELHAWASEPCPHDQPPPGPPPGLGLAPTGG
jgi:aminoglycoside phosphotransferase